MSPPMVTINPDIIKVNVRTRMDVYWPEDNKYYQCKITSLKCNDNRRKYTVTTLLYDNGEIEIVDLTKESFIIINNEFNSLSIRKSTTKITAAKKTTTTATATATATAIATTTTTTTTTTTATSKKRNVYVTNPIKKICLCLFCTKQHKNDVRE